MERSSNLPEFAQLVNSSVGILPWETLLCPPLLSHSTLTPTCGFPHQLGVLQFNSVPSHTPHFRCPPYVLIITSASD